MSSRRHCIRRQAGFGPVEVARRRFRRPLDVSPLRRSWPSILVALWLTALAQAADEPRAGDEAGFVIQTMKEPTDAWTRSGAPLGLFDPVFPGDQILPPAHPQTDSSIQIALYDGTVLPGQCGSAGHCAPIQVPKAKPPEGFNERFWAALKRLFPHESDLPVIAAVRGAGPREAVLERTAASLDLAPALAEVGPGRYGAELRPWTAGGPATSGTTLELVWRHPVATALSGSPPEPGLYELTLTNRAGDVVGGALVLVASQADFAPMSRAFDRVRGLADKWEDAVGEAAARRFQVESLQALARDPSAAGSGP
jgi:hypothetical protein